jgi:transposase
MRQVHKAGEKLFVDYSGKKPAIVDATTGVVRPVDLFVAVLGASNYTTPRRPRRNGARTSFRATAARWNISTASRPPSCPIS